MRLYDARDVAVCAFRRGSSPCRITRQTLSQEVAQIAEGRRDATRDWTLAGGRKSPNQNLSLGSAMFSLLSYKLLQQHYGTGMDQCIRRRKVEVIRLRAKRPLPLWRSGVSVRSCTDGESNGAYFPHPEGAEPTGRSIATGGYMRPYEESRQGDFPMRSSSRFPIARWAPIPLRLKIHDFSGHEGAKLLRGFEFKGGGGTDFRPAIAEAANRKPDLLIYLTDLEGNAGEEPTFPVLCAVPEGKSEAPWGKVVELD
jgi:hypothetical protein